MAESLVELQNMFALHSVEKRIIFASPQDSNHDSSVAQPMGAQFFFQNCKENLEIPSAKRGDNESSSTLMVHKCLVPTYTI